VIGYDGSPTAEHAIREAGALLAGEPAIVLVVWKQGRRFELLDLPAATIGLPAASVDPGTALEIDEAMRERAQRLAQNGAGLACKAGFDAEGLAVADDVDVSVSETIVRVAHERDARAVVVGAHGHGAVSEVILGSTTRDVIRHALVPVLVVRQTEH
jgi:nucleotide-binding universal stress UspA family protein